MKEITAYEAFDGTLYKDGEKCKEHENSEWKIRLNTVKTFSTEVSSPWLPICDPTDTYMFVVPKTIFQVGVLNQFIYSCVPLNGQNPIFTKESIDRPYLVGYRMYDEDTPDWCWAYSLDDLISQATLDSFTLIRKCKK